MVSTDKALVIVLRYILIIKQNILILISLVFKIRLVIRKDRITNLTFKLSLARIIDKIVGACTWAFGSQ